MREFDLSLVRNVVVLGTGKIGIAIFKSLIARVSKNASVIFANSDPN